MNFEILTQLSELKNPTNKETTRFSHSIHPYPAKYIPQIPNRIITEFSNERHTVLDPFCGCGTTLLESKLLGRDSIGMDLNPIGVMISRVKTTSIGNDEIQFFNDFRIKLISAFKKTKKTYWIPEIPNLEHWFSPESIIGLAKIVDCIRKVTNDDRRRILNLVLSNIIVGVSNQESETRFAAKPNDITTERVLELFLAKFDSITKKLIETSNQEKFNTAQSKVILSNTANIQDYVQPRSIDLIVTSPPYLNSFDYYLYHKFRIYWISYPENLDEVFPISVIKKEEIGSRYRYSGVNSDEVSTFRDEMKLCFTSFNNILKPTKMLFMVVGDSIVKGDFMSMDSYYESLLEECGFKMLSKISYAMSGASRSFMATNTVNKHYANKKSHILAFQALNITKTDKVNERIVLPSFVPAQAQEVDYLPKKIETGSNFFIKANNVTKYTHGLIKYPAKYIPQIPEWAINTYSKSGDTVLDPFNGSGTTGVECLLNERNYIGIDVNPFAVLASKAKVTPIPESELSSARDRMLQLVKKTKLSKESKIEFELQEFWFNPAVLEKLFLIKQCINEVENESVRNLMLVSLSSIIKKASYLDEGQLKVKRSAQKFLSEPADPIDLFFKRFQKDCDAISSLDKVGVTNLDINFYEGSAFNLISAYPSKVGSIDLIVTSPPYINAMNYPMYHRYELLILGLIHPDDYVQHQTKYIGTERVYSKNYRSFEPIFPEVQGFEKLNDTLKKIFEKEPKRYFITKKYFEDMHSFFSDAFKLLKKNKKLVLVCGTNTIKGEPINTSFELSLIAQNVGFTESLHFSYEIRKHRFKLTRHQTAGKINNDIVIVLEKT